MAAVTHNDMMEEDEEAGMPKKAVIDLDEEENEEDEVVGLSHQIKDNTHLKHVIPNSE